MPESMQKLKVKRKLASITNMAYLYLIRKYSPNINDDGILLGSL